MALVSHWNFDEGSGSTALDSAGSNPGTITGAAYDADAPTLAVSNPFSLLFGGSDSVNAGGDSSLKPASAFTISFWMKSSNVSATQFAISHRASGATKGFLFFFTGGSFFFFFTVDGSNWQMLTPNSGLSNGVWYHVAGTYQNGSGLLYINGVQQTSTSSATGSIVYDSGDFTIGDDADAGQGFQGRLDEVRVYNTALTAGQIAILAAGGEPSSGGGGGGSRNIFIGYGVQG